MCQWWRNYRKAIKWQKRATELYEKGKYKDDSWDCDIRVAIMIEEMKQDGLIVKASIGDYGLVTVNGDFYPVRGTIQGYKHIRLILRGNYIVDPSSNNKPAGFKQTWPVKLIWK